MGIKIITNDKLWMEQEAIQQLKQIASYDGVIEVVGLPDLHSGKMPVGTTVQTKDIIYPNIIGNDIGCGMSLFNTKIKIKKVDFEKVIKNLQGTSLEGKYSIGGGNHFAELQSIDKIYSKDEAIKLSLNKSYLYVLVHSGSRGRGNIIYHKFFSEKGIHVDDRNFMQYIQSHDEAIMFAKENRKKVASIVLEKAKLKSTIGCVVDCVHNYIECKGNVFSHHKGSISTLENEYAIIAGSRGSYSYLVKCKECKDTLNSISHGAGRKWARNHCKGRLENKYKRDELYKTKLGGTVVLNDKSLLYEEAPEAYKNIDDIISILQEYKAIEVVARFKPLVTYKC